MFRLAVAGAGIVALVSVAAYLVPWSLAAPYLPGIDLMPLLSAIALVISLVAAAAALRAMHHVSRLRSDILLLARSIDLALKDVVARTDKETATIGEMTTSVAREIDRLSERVALRENVEAAAPPAINVVQHPSARRRRTASSASHQSPAPDASAVESAYRAAVAAGEFEISLQPIVSVAQSAASGFEVFASLPIDGGQRIDVRRPADPAASAEAAAFEQLLVTAALRVGRKRLGAASASMPLHVPVSEAILTDSKGLSAVLDMLQFYPDLARLLVLSIPAVSIGGRHEQALDMLASKGVRFAAEGWDEAVDMADPLPAGLSFLKVPANRLLDRERARRKAAPASTIIERAAVGRLAIIATEVSSDEDAVNLIDLGVDLMSGPRFGGPRRLKPEGAGKQSGRLALI